MLSVRMRDVLGASDHLKRLGQAAGIEWRIVTGVSVGGEHSQALGHDPLRGSALEHALATSVVGLIEAAQQGLQILVAGNRDAQHLALDASVEAFDHAIRARRVGPRRAMLHPELLARCLEAVGREAALPPIIFPGRPERWWGDEALKAEADPPQATLEQRHQATGDILALRRRGFFSTGVLFSMASHIPVETTQ